MLRNVAYFLIFGKPLVMYLGILTLLSFVSTASIAILHRRGIPIVPFRWHPRMAIFSIAMGVMHGILGLSLYF